MEQLEMEWVKEMSVPEMDSYIKKLRELKIKYDEAKAKADEASREYNKQKQVVIEALTQAGKQSYIVDGVGKVKVIEADSVRVPKTREQKEAFFNWIKNRLGEEAYYAYMTVNSQSLNSLYKRMLEESRSRGEGELKIDGLEEPNKYYKLSFTKA